MEPKDYRAAVETPPLIVFVLSGVEEGFDDRRDRQKHQSNMQHS